MANIMGLNTGAGTGNAKKPYIKGGWNDPNKAEVVTPVFTDSTTKTPTTTGTGSVGNSYDYGGYTSPTYDAGVSNSYNDYLAQLQAAKEEALAKANAAIDEQTKVAERKYNTQKKQVARDYQDVRNQNSTNWFKLKRNQRETLANQGRLDSGAGRMERTTLDNNMTNNLNKINLQEKSELEAIGNAIAELYANAGSLKAQNEMSLISPFATAMMNGLSSGVGTYNYNPSTSQYLAQAQEIANTPYTTTNAVNDGRFANATTAAIVDALKNQYVKRRTGSGSGNLVI